MNRKDFIGKLSMLLAGLPEGERREAVQYYEDYLSDAGVGPEEDVQPILGTPEEVAASIRDGLKDVEGRQGVFSERGFSQADTGAKHEMIQEDLNRRYRDRSGADKTTGKKGMSGGMIVLLVLLGILAFPVLIPVAVAALVIAAVFLAAVVAVVVCFLLAGVLCVAVGVISLIAACTKLALYPAGALFLIGASLLIIGLGILLTMLLAWVTFKAFPAFMRGTVNLCSSLLRRKGGRAS